MALLNRVHRDHTIDRFRGAIDARRRASEVLEEAGVLGSSLYLLGYTCEMLLKMAYFRLQGRGRRTSIMLADVRAARDHARTLQVVWSGKQHDLRGWRDLLLAERSRLRRPYALALRRGLLVATDTLSNNWWEDLRYHPNRPTKHEYREVRLAADWMFRVRREL